MDLFWSVLIIARKAFFTQSAKLASLPRPHHVRLIQKKKRIRFDLIESTTALPQNRIPFLLFRVFFERAAYRHAAVFVDKSSKRLVIARVDDCCLQHEKATLSKKKTPQDMIN